ncbi:MAG TPA: BlaI/MecI/CopY family transcriptional regulator [Planctomycetaceae bacterium]|nr:BlaI/MecI/CopY family transcriptional regulator [Planctomycetaceae bacterium]
MAKHKLAVLQLAIIQVLWERSEATVAEVREALQETRPLAHTTVGTMLAKMERNGQVRHRFEGRVNIYRAAVQREKVRRSMLADLTAQLFGGDLAEMVSHLLDSREVSADELARLKQLIRDKEERRAK